MKVLIIRKATLGDAEELALLAHRTFGAAYLGHPSIPNDELEEYMAESFSPTKTADLLADPNVTFLLVEQDSDAVGYARLNFATDNFPSSETVQVELSRFYTDQRVWGTGIGQLLMQSCVETAQKLGGEKLWLMVWEFGDRAQKFYRKNGFEIVGKRLFRLKTYSTEDFLMERPIGVRHE